MLPFDTLEKAAEQIAALKGMNSAWNEFARNVGITAHDEEAAMRCIELYDFDTVLFPFNWFLHLEYGMGARLLKAAKERGMGVLCMKAFVERCWESTQERKTSVFPKSWCKPIDVEDTKFGIAAMKYALSLGVDTLLPPGNFPSFSFAVDHIDECLKEPLNENDLSFLKKKLELLRGKGFFDPSKPGYTVPIDK